MRLLFLGCGNIGRPILNLIAASGVFSEIDVIDTSFKEEIAEGNIKYLNKLKSSVGDFYDCLFLAIKPQVFSQDVIKEYLKMNFNIVFSIMAGKTIDSIKDIFGPNQKVARIMPNMGVTSGKSYSLLTWNDDCFKEDVELINKITGLLGKYKVLDENFFNIGTIATSCFPGFIYKFCSVFALEIASSRLAKGIDEKEIEIMVINGLISATNNIEQNPELTLSELTSKICSKGGMTEVGVNILSSEQFSDIISDILVKTTERAKNL